MPDGLRKRHILLNWWTVAILLGICTMAFLFISINLETAPMQNFDERVIHYVQGHMSDSLTPIMLHITYLGSVIGIIIFTVVCGVGLFISRKSLYASYLFITVALGAWGFNRMLKLIYVRERPSILRIVEESGYSFPSGHTMGATIFYGSLGFILVSIVRRTWQKTVIILLATVIIFFIGLSRIYLGVHYPSDIIGGFSAGLGWLMLSVSALYLIEKNYHN